MVSMGHSKKLEEDNGLNRFVMQREIARQERLLEEERKKVTFLYHLFVILKVYFYSEWSSDVAVFPSLR